MKIAVIILYLLLALALASAVYLHFEIKSLGSMIEEQGKIIRDIGRDVEEIEEIIRGVRVRNLTVPRGYVNVTHVPVVEKPKPKAARISGCRLNIRVLNVFNVSAISYGGFNFRAHPNKTIIVVRVLIENLGGESFSLSEILSVNLICAGNRVYPSLHPLDLKPEFNVTGGLNVKPISIGESIPPKSNIVRDFIFEVDFGVKPLKVRVEYGFFEGRIIEVNVSG